MKEVALVPKPVPDLAVKVSLGPQIEEEVDRCTRVHSLLPPTLQIVISFMLPPTVHVKVKVSPGQVGGAAVNCAVTSPEREINELELVVHIVVHAMHPGK